MKMLGTHSKLAQKPKISVVSTFSRIWLSLEFGSFNIGYLGTLWFEIQAELDFDPVRKPVDLM